MTNFIAEFSYTNTAEVAETVDGAEAAKVVEERDKDDSAPIQEETQQWTLYVDGTSNENGYGVGMMLISLEGHKIHCALCFRFQASNNEVEYEALIAGVDGHLYLSFYQGYPAIQKCKH